MFVFMSAPVTPTHVYIHIYTCIYMDIYIHVHICIYVHSRSRRYQCRAYLKKNVTIQKSDVAREQVVSECVSMLITSTLKEIPTAFCAYKTKHVANITIYCSPRTSHVDMHVNESNFRALMSALLIVQTQM